MSSACRGFAVVALTADDQGSAGPASGDPLTIHQASRMLSVPVTTLRSWERRYNVPRTARTSGGHRRYTTGAIDELRLMRDEIARGKRAGDAAVSARLLLQPPEVARPFVDAFLTAARALDTAGVRTSLEEAVVELGLGATLDEVLMPGMRRIGRWWETGVCDVGAEHLATEAVRTWLGRIVAFAPEPSRNTPVLLACGPRDTHTVGVEAFGALLTSTGRQCRLLGARTPVASLVTAVHRLQPGGVVVVSHLALARRPAVEAVRAVAGLGARTFYAGNAFVAAPVRQRVPGTYLGDSLRDAARLVEATLTG
jgi:methanogenic corrinoid protein MtbC1